MDIINCTIDSPLEDLDDMSDNLIIQIFEAQEDEDTGDTAVGGDSICISDDDIEGGTVAEVHANPIAWEVLENDPRTDYGGYFLRKKEA